MQKSNLTEIAEIKERSYEVFQHIAIALDSKAANGKRSFKAWFRTDRTPSAGYAMPNNSRPYQFYKDFSTGENLDCIAAWQRAFDVDFKTAIAQIKTFLNLDNTVFAPPIKVNSKYLQTNIQKGFLPSEIVQVPIEQMTASCQEKYYIINPLFVTLCELFDKEKVTKAFDSYHVGIAQKARHKHHKSGVWCDLYGTVFWYTDVCGRVRYANIIAYQNGKRFGIPLQPDKHQHTGLTKPFFGEHGLAYPETLYYFVYIMESEKTALMLHLEFPFTVGENGEKRQNIYIASGGASGITVDKILPIVPFLQKAIEVVILPDADEAGRKGAKAGLENLRNCGVTNATIQDDFEGRWDGYDYGDCIFEARKNTPKPTNDTKTNEPATDTLNEPQSEQNAIVADVLEIVEPDTNEPTNEPANLQSEPIEMLLQSTVFKWQVTPIPYGLAGDDLIAYIVQNCPIDSDTNEPANEPQKQPAKPAKDTNKRRMRETYIPTKKPNQSTIVF